MSVHVFNFLFRREIFETRPNPWRLCMIQSTIYTSHQRHVHWIMIHAILKVIFLPKTIGLIRLIKSEVHLCKLLLCDIIKNGPDLNDLAFINSPVQKVITLRDWQKVFSHVEHRSIEQYFTLKHKIIIQTDENK